MPPHEQELLEHLLTRRSAWYVRSNHGLVVEGGGERKGIEGIVGIEGMVGIVIEENGGNVILGRVGMVGSVGMVGMVGIGGSGGKVVLGRVGATGRGGNGGGNVGLGNDGMVGMAGKGDGGAGLICSRSRAARHPLLLRNDRIVSTPMKKVLEAMINV